MPKKLPMRQCAGCRERSRKIRWCGSSVSPEGVISLDFRGKAPGRGVYVCPDIECLKRAIKAHALERSLNTAIPEEVYAALEERMAHPE